jgi:hypothetical protein
MEMENKAHETRISLIELMMDGEELKGENG